MAIPGLLSIFRRASGPTVAARPVPATELRAYCAVDTTRELRQGEILSNLTYYEVTRNSDDPSKVDTNAWTLSLAIVLTADCDLLQDFLDRRDGKISSLFNVLLFGAEDAIQCRKRIGYNGKQWKLVTQNAVDRFYYLKAIEPNADLSATGIPDTVIDFKRYFTLPAPELYQQFGMAGDERAVRRCRLTDLWREDLQRRAMSFMQRVGIPDPSDER